MLSVRLRRILFALLCYIGEESADENKIVAVKPQSAPVDAEELVVRRRCLILICVDFWASSKLIPGNRYCTYNIVERFLRHRTYRAVVGLFVKLQNRSISATL